mgnify:CR=1 FL=1
MGWYRLQDLLQAIDHFLPEGLRLFVKPALESLVFRSSCGGLDGDGIEAEGTAVIGARSHVECTCLDGEFEAPPHEVAPHPGHTLAAELVEVHIGMEASALFVFYAGVFAWLDPVEGFCLFAEEAERVGVAAGDWLTPYKRVSCFLPEAEG